MVDDIKTKKPITDEIATTDKDVNVFSGWITRLENPDPTLRTEAGGKGLKLYDEVDRDSHAGSVLQSRCLAVVGKDWEVLPGKSAKKAGRPATTEQDEVIAEFVKQILLSCNFNQARLELLQAILYGFYVAEVLWEYADGTVKIKKIMGKHPRRFCFTLERELRLLTPQNMIDGESVPERKFILFTFADSDNPYGKGLGRKLWWPVWFKKHGIKYWLVFLEKFGMPTAVGKYPQGTEPEQQQALLDAIDAIQQETGVKIPDTMAIDLLEAARAGTVSYESLCEYMDKQMSKAVLCQTGTTEGTPGKLGNEASQGEAKQEVIEADADLLDECLNETLIRWIVDYNFPAVTEYPRLKTRAEKKPDLKEQSEIDKIVTVDIGVPVGRKYFYETYGIPEPDTGEDVVMPALSVRLNQAGREFAERKGQYSPEQENIETLVRETAKQAESAMSGVLDPVRKMIAGAGSLEDLRDNILQVYSDMDPAELEELTARAMYVAEIYGRAAVAKKTA